MKQRTERTLIVLGAVAAVCLVAALLAGCDSFLTVDGVVVDCVTESPVSGVEIRAVLVQGVGEPESNVRSGDAGEFLMVFNEPPSSVVELSFSRSGYRATTVRAGGGAEDAVRVCLRPLENRD